MAVDPDTGHIYETEDSTNPHGLLLPVDPAGRGAAAGQGLAARAGRDAGTLAALKARTASGAFVPDLCVATEPGTTYAVEWVTVPDRDGVTGLGPPPVQRDLGRRDMVRPAGW